jgi:hypothetical protein
VENGLQLVSVKVNGCEGNDIEDIPLGDPFQIVVQLKAHQRVEGARFQLQFYDGTETRAAEIASREAGPGSLTLDGQLELRFEVLHNALVPDRYRVDFQIKGPSVPQVLLHAPSLCPFRIAERILPGAWGPYTRVHGAVYLQSRVQVVPQPKA